MVVHDKRPTDLEEWYPHWFRERDPQDPNPTFPDGIGTVPGGFGPEDAGKHLYSGKARTYVYDEIICANRWARGLRWLYNGGIVALLWGVTFLVWPPRGEASSWRIAAKWVAGGSAVIESVWSLVVLVGDLLFLLDAWTKRR